MLDEAHARHFFRRTLLSFLDDWTRHSGWAFP
jgi:hypothetical protein